MIRILLFTLILGCAFAESRPTKSPYHSSLDAAKAEATQSDKFLLAFFYDQDSLLSRRMKEEVLDSPMLARPLADFVKAAIAAGNRLSPEGRAARELSIQQFPTIIFYDSKGRELDRAVGYKDAPELLRATVEAVDPRSNYILLKERLKKNPHDVESLYFMGRKYLRRGNQVEAAKYFDKVADLDPDNKLNLADNLLLRRAERLMSETKFDQALEMLRRLEKNYPESDENDFAAYLKARLLWMTGEKDQAFEAYRSFIEQYPLSEYKERAAIALRSLEEGAPTSMPASTAPTSQQLFVTRPQ